MSVRIEDIHKSTFEESITYLPSGFGKSNPPISGLTPFTTNGYTGLGVHHPIIYSTNYNFTITNTAAPGFYQLPAVATSNNNTLAAINANLFGSSPSSNGSQEIYFSTFNLYAKVGFTELDGVDIVESSINNLIGITRGTVHRKAGGAFIHKTNVLGTWVDNPNKDYNFFDFNSGIVVDFADSILVTNNEIQVLDLLINLNITNTDVLRFGYVSTVIKFNI